MRKMILPVLFMVAGCATANTVRIKTDQAFLTGQLALKTAQQTVMAVCSTPTKPEPQCNQAIDILHTGALAEDAGHTALLAGNAKDLNAAVATLTSLPQQLVALGLIKGN